MLIEKTKLSNLLNEFWDWFGYSKENYAEMSRQFDPGEFMFPKWSELLEVTEVLILLDPEDDQTIDDMLTVMALDNESEIVLDDIISYASNELVHRIVERGVSHMQHEARWQIAEILLRRKPENALAVLDALALDEDSYVRQRAQNAIDWFSES